MQTALHVLRSIKKKPSWLKNLGKNVTTSLHQNTKPNFSKLAIWQIILFVKLACLNTWISLEWIGITESEQLCSTFLLNLAAFW